MRPWLCALAVLACTARPVAPPDAGPTLRYPTVPNGGGAVLSDVELVSVTLGPDATQSHDAFTQWLAASGWLTQRAGEYGAQQVRYGGAVELAAPGAMLLDEELRGLLRAAGVQPGKLYVVWLPPGVNLIDRYGNRTCFSNPGTGYHEALDAEGVPYVAVPACPARFSAIFDVPGSMHFDAARLVVDALTNPSPRNAPAFAVTDPTNPWVALGAEVGDFCWGRFAEHEGVKLQRVWSNAAVLRGDEPCQPAPAGPAFGFTVDPAGRHRLNIGEEVAVTVTGWANGPRADWSIEVTPWWGDFGMQATLDRTTLNDGVQATMLLKVPYPKPPGTAGAMLLRALGGDDTPLWPVGFVTR